MSTGIGSAALSVFLTEAETALIEAAEQEAKDLGKKFLPELITRTQNAITNLGSTGAGNFKFLHDIEVDMEKKALEAILALENDALNWCNEAVTPPALAAN